MQANELQWTDTMSQHITHYPSVHSLRSSTNTDLSLPDIITVH